jgi:hypothetical protein
MMVELARYTLCLRSGIRPGKVVASGLTRTEAAMAIARNLHRCDIGIRAADYETFRSFEMTRFSDDFDLVIASATVPKSASFENDKAYALELIEMQILRRAETLWDGEVYADDEFARRDPAVRRAGRLDLGHAGGWLEHERVRAILQPSQIRRYAELRGYGADQAPVHHKHNQE